MKRNSSPPHRSEAAVISGTGNGRGDSLPQLLTQDEAVQMLRLDRLGLRDPKESLRYLRRTGQIGFVKVANRVLYPLEALREYLTRQTVQPR